MISLGRVRVRVRVITVLVASMVRVRVRVIHVLEASMVLVGGAAGLTCHVHLGALVQHGELIRVRVTVMVRVVNVLVASMVRVRVVNVLVASMVLVDGGLTCHVHLGALVQHGELIRIILHPIPEGLQTEQRSSSEVRPVC